MEGTIIKVDLSRMTVEAARAEILRLAVVVRGLQCELKAATK